MDRSDRTPSPLELAVRLTRPVLVLVAFGLLASLETIHVADASPWLLVAGGGLVVAAAAGAGVAALVHGLRHGGGGLPAAAAAGALLAGYLVATIAWSLEALGQPVELESGRATQIGELAAAVLLAVAAVAWSGHDRVRTGRGGMVLRLLLVFIAVEAVLAAAIFLPGEIAAALVATRPLAAVVLATTAGFVLISGALSERGWQRRPAAMAEACLLLAAGSGTLALARAGTLDLAPGMAALAIGIVVVALALRRPAAVATAPAQPAPDPDVAALLMRAAAEEAARREGRDEASRLARELRGTIDELTQARRTIARQREELERASRLDELTGVTSRRTIIERLETEVAEARRYAHPLAVLIVDIDGLSAANGNGWQGGDAVLRELALRMRLRVRSADGIGRLGDDSFLAILPHTNEEGAAVFAETLRQRTAERPVETDAGPIEVRVSIGVATLHPGLDMEAVELLALAEAAVREAQHGGGDCVAIDQLRRLPRRTGADPSVGHMAQDTGA